MKKTAYVAAISILALGCSLSTDHRAPSETEQLAHEVDLTWLVDQAAEGLPLVAVKEGPDADIDPDGWLFGETRAGRHLVDTSANAVLDVEIDVAHDLTFTPVVCFVDSLKSTGSCVVAELLQESAVENRATWSATIDPNLRNSNWSEVIVTSQENYLSGGVDAPLEGWVEYRLQASMDSSLLQEQEEMVAAREIKCIAVDLEGNEVPCDDGPTCTQEDIDAKEPDCECATAQELEKVIAVHQENIETFNESITALRGTLAALNAAIDEIMSHVDGFEYEVGGRCLLAGVEAYGAGKILTTFKSTCGHLGYAAQCKAAGFTTAEVAKYLVTKKAVQGTTEGLIISAITAIGNHGIPQGPKPWSYKIPIVGGWCAAYDSSSVVFSSPEAIDALGRNAARVMREIGRLRALIKVEEEAIAELRRQIAEACDGGATTGPGGK